MQRKQMGRTAFGKTLWRAAAAAALMMGMVWLLAGGMLVAKAGKSAPEGASLRAAEPTEPVSFPLETAHWRVSDPYGWREDPFTGEEAFHRGVDLACAEGTRVLAMLDGTVTAARRSETYGNYLRLTHADGQETLYAHLQYLYVRAGEVVQKGQCLGIIGQTGRATGAHLHLEFLVQGIRYDPGKALGLP